MQQISKKKQMLLQLQKHGGWRCVLAGSSVLNAVEMANEGKHLRREDERAGCELM